MIRGAAPLRYQNGDLAQQVEALSSSIPAPTVTYIWGWYSYTGYGVGVLSPITLVTGDIIVTSDVAVNACSLVSFDQYDNAVVPSFEFVLTEDGVEFVALTIVPGDWTTISGVLYTPNWTGQLTKTFPTVTLTPGHVYGMAYRGAVVPYNRLSGHLTFYTI